MSAKKIIFVTGTDTGVGKTLLTAMLLQHLRQTGQRVLAMKPFCSGGLGDIHLLQSLQPGELSNAEMNPFYFPQAIAPLVAAKKNRKPIRLSEVVEKINQVKRKCDRIIIEGSGGLLVPLGKDYTVADLIAALDCQVFVAARNQLGTINHTLLTVQALRSIGIKANEIRVILMSGEKVDLSARTNKKTIASLVRPTKVFELPFLGKDACTTKSVKKNCLKFAKLFENVMKS